MAAKWRRGAAGTAALVSVTAVALVVVLPLGAHVERDPFFVDPAADTSIVPAAGGTWVKKRSLRDPVDNLRIFKSAVARGAAKGKVLARFARLSKAQQAVALRSVGRTRAAKYGLTDPRIQAEETLVVCQADSIARLKQALGQVRLARAPKTDRRRKAELLSLNQRFASLCRFKEIQAAVNASDNNDTVVVMPGFYTEPTSRAKPHNDPTCSSYVASGSRSAPAPTYEYHVKCPNDINLIAIIGREMGDNDKAKCLRCNLHIVGSGVRPEDVVIDGAKDPKDPGVTDKLFVEGRKAVEPAKEVGFRFERTDGGYIGNMTAVNFAEHGFYSIETDGMTFDEIKAYYNQEYGHLSFVTDHLIVQDGDFAGSGDAGVYPGASPPSNPRLNTIIRRNRSHHNTIGISGSMGSALHIIDNEFDNNSSGVVMDSISRAGHPGYPQRGTVFEGNRIHSNNFDTYSESAWVRSTTLPPIGVGVLIGGGNDNITTDNWIYDNWRWGVGLITVPDIVTEQDSPDDLNVSTSHRNQVIGNRFGVAPDGTKMPNGVDIWWDELGQANCWERNGEGVKSDPSPVPNCTANPNIGHGNPVKEAELLVCANASPRKPGTTGCSWWDMPKKPAGGRR
jgi:hypothetical protein